MKRRRFLLGAGAVAAAAGLPAIPAIAEPQIAETFISLELNPLVLQSYARRALTFSLGPGVEMPLGAQVFFNDIEFVVDEIRQTATETLISAIEALKPKTFEVRGTFKWIDPEVAKWDPC